MKKHGLESVNLTEVAKYPPNSSSKLQEIQPKSKGSHGLTWPYMPANNFMSRGKSKTVRSVPRAWVPYKCTQSVPISLPESMKDE